MDHAPGAPPLLVYTQSIWPARYILSWQIDYNVEAFKQGQDGQAVDLSQMDQRSGIRNSR